MSEWQALVTAVAAAVVDLPKDLQPIVADYVRVKAHILTPSVSPNGSYRSLVSPYSVDDGPSRWQFDIDYPTDGSFFAVRIGVNQPADTDGRRIGVATLTGGRGVMASSVVILTSSTYICVPVRGRCRIGLAVDVAGCSVSGFYQDDDCLLQLGAVADRFDVDFLRLLPAVMHSENVGLRLVAD